VFFFFWGGGLREGSICDSLEFFIDDINDSSFLVVAKILEWSEALGVIELFGAVDEDEFFLFRGMQRL
jgi:hypothetical protein